MNSEHTTFLKIEHGTFLISEHTPYETAKRTTFLISEQNLKHIERHTQERKDHELPQ